MRPIPAKYDVETTAVDIRREPIDPGIGFAAHGYGRLDHRHYRLSLLVSVGALIREYFKDRFRVAFGFTAVPGELHVSVVNAGYRPVYLRFVGFVPSGGGELIPFEPELRIEGQRPRAIEPIQPGQPVEYVVDADWLKTMLDRGIAHVAARSAGAKRHQRDEIPRWAIDYALEGKWPGGEAKPTPENDRRSD